MPIAPNKLKPTESDNCLLIYGTKSCFKVSYITANYLGCLIY